MDALSTQALVLDVPGRGDGYALDVAPQPGQVWGILGPNGAGKTTLLHTLAGLRAPRRGQVLLAGKPLSGLSRRRIARAVGLMFQDQHDGFPATVLETVMIGRHPHLAAWQGESAGDIALAEQALAALDLKALSQRLVSTLSGGERQRVTVATLMTQNPGVWLADEPTNHLDLHHQVHILRLLSARAAAGCSVVMSLHDLNLAARWCSHILLLYPDGRACWGEAGLMMVPGALEDLYGQRLSTAEVDGIPVFVPRL